MKTLTKKYEWRAYLFHWNYWLHDLRVELPKVLIFLLFTTVFSFAQSPEELQRLSTDNQVYKQYRQVFFKYYILKDKDTLLVKILTDYNKELPYEEKWKLEKKSKFNPEQGFSTVHYLATTIKEGEFMGTQSLLQYDYVDKNRRGILQEQAGLAEFGKNISMYPPRMYHFGILALNPFPEIKEPCEEGNTWATEKEITDMYASEKWGKWNEVIKVNSTYRIRNEQTIKTNIGFMKCLVVEADAESSLGKTRLVSYFNPEYGFVKLNFYNIDGSILVMDINTVRQF